DTSTTTTGTTTPPAPGGSPLDFTPSGGPDPYNTRMDALRALAGPEQSFDPSQQTPGDFTSGPGGLPQAAPTPPPAPTPDLAPKTADDYGGDYYKSLVEELHKTPDLNAIKESLIGPLRAAYADVPMTAAQKVGLFALALSNPEGAMDMIKQK